MKITLLLAITFYSCSTFFLQNKLEDQLPAKAKYDETLVDDVYGITLYEPLNMILSGDSVRKENGYVVQNWQEDYYENGQLLHKGYYIDGQLKVYKNYYPDGTLERSFVNVDGYKSKSTLYYPNGKIKSQVVYLEGNPKVWTDYYKNGNIEYYEEYHKSMLYHIAKRSYYESGKAESLFELTHKKKLTYSQKDFFENGNNKMAGNAVYDKNAYDYFKVGKWLYFSENGKLIKDETYSDGVVSKTNTY